jgi:4-azaleucine resistance transporter AzlC
MIQRPEERAEFIAGFQGVLPLVIGSIPFAIIFGAVAVNNGLSPLTAAAMSAFVYAGSAQFVGAGMVATGAGNWVIILTTLIVNLRHVLYATTLAPHMKHLSQRWMLPLGFWLTDESFVVAIQRYYKNDGSSRKQWYHLGTTLPMYLNWQFFTWGGIWAGGALPNAATWGMDFAFPATFIAMLIPLIVSRSIAACVICAGIATILFYNLPNHLGLIVAALCGVGAGVLIEQWYPTPAPMPAPLPTSMPNDQVGQSAYQRANVP